MNRLAKNKRYLIKGKSSATSTSTQSFWRNNKMNKLAKKIRYAGTTAKKKDKKRRKLNKYVLELEAENKQYKAALKEIVALAEDNGQSFECGGSFCVAADIAKIGLKG